MNEAIFTGSGIDIIKRESEYFIRYDTGTIAMIEKESKITSEEASKAQEVKEMLMKLLLPLRLEKGKTSRFFQRNNGVTRGC
ncbi:hypothetical protein UXP03_01505 [Enterobacter hormaechei]